MSSPGFTTTTTSSGRTARTSPARKRAAPTPPARATTGRVSGRGIRSGGSAGCRVALRAQVAQLALELGQAIGDRGHVGRVVGLLRRAFGIADVVAECRLVGGDLLLELGDP